MAQKYIVLGTVRNTGKIQVLAAPDVAPPKQKEILVENARNDEFSEVQMFDLQAHSRVYRPELKSKPKKAESPIKPTINKTEITNEK